MVQRCGADKYMSQLIQTLQCIKSSLGAWLAVGEDWYRDVRLHHGTLVLLDRHEVRVVAMQGSVSRSKNFYVVLQIGVDRVGSWVQPIGDHPFVVVQGSNSLARRLCSLVKRPVEVTCMSADRCQIFSYVFKAFCSRCHKAGHVVANVRGVLGGGSQSEGPEHGFPHG